MVLLYWEKDDTGEQQHEVKFVWVTLGCLQSRMSELFHWRWSSLSTERYDIPFVYGTHRTTDKSLWILTRWWRAAGFPRPEQHWHLNFPTALDIYTQQERAFAAALFVHVTQVPQDAVICPRYHRCILHVPTVRPIILQVTARRIFKQFTMCISFYSTIFPSRVYSFYIVDSAIYWFD